MKRTTVDPPQYGTESELCDAFARRASAAVVTPPQPWMSFPAFDGIVRWHPSFGGDLRLPEIPLQGSGGCPCPRSMSTWRHKALQLCVLLDSRGYLTSQDFKAAGVDSTRWVQERWLRDSGERVTLPGKGGAARPHTKYVWGLKRDRAPDVGYEAERAIVAAQAAS